LRNGFPAPRAGLATAQAQQLKLWDQCGGQGGNCKEAAICMDGPFPGKACPSGFTCLKQSNWYYQCLPTESYTCIPATTNAGSSGGSGSSSSGGSGGGSGSPQTSLAMWQQCGGLDGNCQTYGCVDGTYAK
jgi:hypothetical protein